MKVLHIISSIDKSAGGPSRSVPQTCERLSALDVDIILVTQPTNNPTYSRNRENFTIHFKTFWQLILFGLKLSKKNTDLIHLQHVWDPYIHVMAQIARFKGIPYLISTRGMLEPFIMSHNPWKKKFGMSLYQRRDLKKSVAIHATSVKEKENLLKLGFTNPIVFIPNGIDISRIKPKTKKFNNKFKNILFLSRVHPQKGIDLLIDAVKQLNSSNLKVTIAGDSHNDYVAVLKEKCRQYGISELIDFSGGVYGDQKWALFQSADIFILPSYSESFGIVVAEALATGIPVITTTGTPWEELQTAHCGWWIDLSVENLVVALTSAINTPSEELKNMGMNGRKLVEEKYDIKTVAANLIDLYSAYSCK